MAKDSNPTGVDMQDNLFGAMYEIARGVIAQQEFDVTKECKIIEVYLDGKGERTGIYKVKSQDAIYDAYAQQGDIYNVDQWVYVQIPNGDYNNSKFIIGQKVDKDNASDIYNLKMPFDNFLGLYNLTINTPMEEHAYWANNPVQGISETLVAEMDENGLYYPKNGDHVWHWENIDDSSIYATQLGIEVDITTLLHGYHLLSGNYGFRIVVRGLGYDENIRETMKEKIQEYYFDTASMYGNVYAYTTGATQQCVIDIHNFLRVDSIDLWFWQDHNFISETQGMIPYAGVDSEALSKQLKDDLEALKNENLSAAEYEYRKNELYVEFSERTSESAESPNIIFNNLRVLLGLALDQLSEETAYLYTYDKLVYGADGTAESGEVKADDRTLHLAWVHKHDNTAELIDTYGALEAAGAKVYWYEYDPEWTPDNVFYDIDNYSHRFGGLYWRPFTEDETLVHLKEEPLDFIVTPNVQKNTSKYKAVIHYNKTYVTSNVIMFSNVEAVETNNANLARNDKIILRIARLLSAGDNGETVLEADDSLGNFFVYDENNSVLANDDNVRFSDIRYYIEPWIKVDEYDPENPEETDGKYGYQRLTDYQDADTGKKLNFTISWQFPDSLRYTMIRYWDALDNNHRNESYWNNRSDELFARDCEATRYFQISPLLDARYTNNTISAVIDIAGMGTFSVKKELLFGQACSFGCEYTPVITISTPAGNSYIDTNVDFEMYCLIYDRQGRLLDENLRSACEFEWKYYGTRYKPQDNRYHENYLGFLGNVIKGRITQPYPFVVEVTVKGAAAYDITVRRGIMVGNNSEFMQTHDIICPNRVEFRSDGQAPIYQSNAFEVITIKDDGTEDELIYPEWQINQEQVLTLVESTSTYPDLIDPTGSYFTKPEDNTCYALAFSAHTLNGNAANPNAYAQQWTEDLLTDEMFTYISFTYGTATVAQAIAFAQNLYPSSLVNEWDGQSLSLDEENSAIIAKMIAAGTKDQKNRFTGVMMGDWSEKGDSSLDVPGLYGFNAGAQSFGFKTDGTGFIGPAGEGRIQFDGRNALISNSAKTCYINLNPRRIEQFMTGDDTNGYTLDNQAWDSVGNQSYSQYFLYSKAPRRVNSFSYTEDDGTKTDNSTAWVANWDQHTDLLWVKPFMEDADNDYFVVDPNYGVATTGGIFARYGRLGHEYPWIISDYGLTQKNIYGRIFLGNPEKNLSVGQNIPTPKFTNEANNEIDKSEIEVPANFFSASFANAKNIIQTGIRADGYLYTKYAAIGGWYVNDGEIYSVDSKTYENDDSSKGFRKAHSNDGYKKDLLNINSKDQFIAFNNGRFVINGKHGWMGFYNDNDGNTIALTATPSAYNMWIDFKNGTVNFGKDSTENSIPHVVINGKNGNAYFAKGNIVIDGENATIFCGVPTNSLANTPNTKGTLQLANILVEAITAGITQKDLSNIYQLQTNYTSTARGEENTGETDLEKFSNIWDSGKQVGFFPTNDGTYVNGKTYYKSESKSDVFTPSFSASVVLTPSGIASVTNINSLCFEMGLSPLKNTGTFTVMFSRKVTYGDITEDSGEQDGTLSAWQVDGKDVDLSDYGITLTNSENATDLTLTAIVTVAVTNWSDSLYEYSESIGDLEPLNKLNLTNITSPNSANQIEMVGTGQLDFTQKHDSSGAHGMRLYIESTDTQAGSKSVLMPIGVGTGVLYNWNIDAQNMYVQGSATIAISLTAGNIMMAEERAESGYGLVATQLWVDDYIVSQVWPQVITVNNAAAKAMKKARAAYNLAAAADEQAAANLAEIEKLAKSAIQKVSYSTDASFGGCGTYSFVDGYGNTVVTIITPWRTHGHKHSFSFSNGVLKQTIKGPNEGAFTTETGVDFSAAVINLSGDSTTGKLSWSTYGGTTGNFNIADTDYFKERAVSAVKMEASTTGTGTGAYAYAYDMNDKKISNKYATCALSLNSTDKTVSLYYSGSAIASYDLSSFYTTAYNAGWNACRDAMGSGTTFTYQRTGRLYSKSTAADGTESYTDRGSRYWYSAGDDDLGGTYYKKPDAK